MKTTRIIWAMAAVGAWLVMTTPGRSETPEKTIRIISREGWNAKTPRADRFKPQTPKMITIHHTAGLHREKDDGAAVLRSIQNSHMTGKDTKWPDIAYHYLIDAKGNIYQGRPDHAKGDTRTNYDPQDMVLVCLLGNFEEQEPTAAQLDALTDVVVWLMQTYDIPFEQISNHRDHAQTLCPGKNLIGKWMDGSLPDQIKTKNETLKFASVLEP